MIYGYQREAYDALRRTLQAHLLSHGLQLPVKPRFHRLLIGSTGTGKSYIAGKVGEEMNWNTYHASVSNWVVLGARETPTMKGLVEWLADDKKPHLFVLDELDKINGEDSWTRNVRVEIFSLVDGRFPFSSMSIDCDDNEDPVEKINKAEKNLKKAMFVGCGAFQWLFDEPASLGFGEKKEHKKSTSDLAKHLQRELVNRFDNDLLVLPTLTKSDYEELVDEILPHLPPDAAAIIKRIAPGRIEAALAAKSGARFVENLLAQAIYEITDADPIIPFIEPIKPKLEEYVPTQAEIDAEAEIDQLWEMPVN